jgi:hypothetical protein
MCLPTRGRIPVMGARRSARSCDRGMDSQ